MGKYLIGFQLMVVGMGTVLITLFILSLFMRFNSMIWNRAKVNKSIKNKEETAEIKEIEEKLQAVKLAAISAAVYSCLKEEKKNYKIISIKRRKTNWKR